jgi:hypothetical protein
LIPAGECAELHGLVLFEAYETVDSGERRSLRYGDTSWMIAMI